MKVIIHEFTSKFFSKFGIRDPLNLANWSKWYSETCASKIGKIQWVPDPNFGERIAVELMDNNVEVLSNNLSHI